MLIKKRCQARLGDIQCSKELHQGYSHGCSKDGLDFWMRHGNEILDEKPYSNHPQDQHLTMVLAKNSKGEYVTWLYNYGSLGFCWGHYFYDYDQALDDYKYRNLRRE